MRLVVVDEINDAEVVAGDWCEAIAHNLICIKWCDEKGNLGVETEQGFNLITIMELLRCYVDVKYLGEGRYFCTTLCEVETPINEEMMIRGRASESA